MKKITAVLLLTCLFSNMCFADCDWSTGITPGPNKTFIYSESCHLAVGKLVQTNKTQAAQIQDYEKAITLKDLAISYSDQRVALWQKSSDDELQRLNSIEAQQSHSDLLYFGLGVIFTAISVYGASKVVGH